MPTTRASSFPSSLPASAYRWRCPASPQAGSTRFPPDLLGKAAGTLNTIQQFGAVFGVAVVTAVFNTHGSLATSAAVTSGYRAALAVSAGASVLGAVVALGIRRARAAGIGQQVTVQSEKEAIPELA